eukprot:gb/GFBE01022269.1/.p1 GENE.gb/GFBE01022269.1/~~gb/GFBE01022269.1/.p1  ORF type:complete len:244 (+),score=32.86 gb/GFBE01022269.1/:1-732(+)
MENASRSNSTTGSGASNATNGTDAGLSDSVEAVGSNGTGEPNGTLTANSSGLLADVNLSTAWNASHVVSNASRVVSNVSNASRGISQPAEATGFPTTTFHTTPGPFLNTSTSSAAPLPFAADDAAGGVAPDSGTADGGWMSGMSTSVLFLLVSLGLFVVAWRRLKRQREARSTGGDMQLTSLSDWMGGDDDDDEIIAGPLSGRRTQPISVPGSTGSADYFDMSTPRRESRTPVGLPRGVGRIR